MTEVNKELKERFSPKLNVKMKAAMKYALKVIAHKYSAKQAVLKNFANSQESTCA